jgi:hypothetical protein
VKAQAYIDICNKILGRKAIPAQKIWLNFLKGIMGRNVVSSGRETGIGLNFQIFFCG